MALSHYDEEMDLLRLSGGHTVLLPSDLDFAIQELKVDDLKEALKRFESQQVPKELRELSEKKEKPPEDAEKVSERLWEWRETRMSQREQLETMIYREERALKLMQALDSEDLDGVRDKETFVFREFGHGERIDAESGMNETIDPEGLTRTTNIIARNHTLFKACLIGKVKVDLEGNAVKPSGNDGEVIDYKGRLIEAFGDPVQEIKDGKATVLLDRMWTRNQMVSVLAPYFRSRRSKPRGKGTGAG